MSPIPTRIDAADQPLEGWDDPARGSILWRTLFSADLTPTEAMVCGVAELRPGDDFTFHRHADPEVYLGLEGEVTVEVDGVPQRLAPGVALFIPGHALHGIRPVTTACRFYYVFARDSFAGVSYHFEGKG